MRALGLGIRSTMVCQAAMACVVAYALLAVSGEQPPLQTRRSKQECSAEGQSRAALAKDLGDGQEATGRCSARRIVRALLRALLGGPRATAPEESESPSSNEPEEATKEARNNLPDGTPVTQESLVRYFVKSLADEDETTRESAADRLFKSHTELTSSVIDALDKEGYAARSRATWALLGATYAGGDFDQAIAPLHALIPNVIEMAEREVEEAKRNEHGVARETAVEDMGRGLTAGWLGLLLGTASPTEADLEKALPVLKDLLNDKSWYVRSKTMGGLCRMASAAKPLVPVLIERLKDPVEQNRSVACGALASMGPDAKAAVPALLRALDERGLPAPAYMALRRIDPDALKAAMNSRDRNTSKP